MSPRLGFLHVPKCGGTSVSAAIFEALGLREFHVSHLRDWGDELGPHVVMRNHVSYRLAQNAPFLSGHITYADMMELRRDVVFSILRDPHAVALSHFTYHLGRVQDPEILLRRPHLEKYKHLTLSEHLEEAKPGRFLSALGKDVFPEQRIIQIAAAGAMELERDRGLRKQIDRVLKRFDLIMAGDLSHQLSSLGRYVDLGEIAIGHKNKSHDNLSFALGAPRQRIIDHLNHLCWLDEYIYARCEALFPETISPLVSDAEKAVDAFITRFRPMCP